ncbi:MAG: 3-dehydro-L-gulonate 2-dehydrogenase [Elusimicrobiota bacterium]|jgi:3-dehydro-L-gulonate 2-dehydrogenase|nr:3-dehydro-L-gulonate 2-dehydrogenase [Elusimicrobiota bacterium]
MRIPFEDMKSEFKRIFLKYGISEEKAEICARTHAETSRDGVYSHGANRIPRFINYVKKGWVDIKAEPTKEKEFGALAVYNGNFGIGVTNAFYCADRAMELAKKNGIGLVGLKNTTHWMRGGTYGLYAAKKGFTAICWTNTESNMPPWGGEKPKLGNNPFVMAAPANNGEPVLLDMAMSLYSYGKLQSTRLAGKKLPFPGGFDKEGKLTDEPEKIEESMRMLPIGYWKGSSFAFLLDVLVSILSDGASTQDMDKIAKGSCGGCSQIFIMIDPLKISSQAYINEILNKAKAYIKTADGKEIRYPGEGMSNAFKENSSKGVLVDDTVWAEIKSL